MVPVPPTRDLWKKKGSRTLQSPFIGCKISQDRWGALKPRRRARQPVCRMKTDLHRWSVLLLCTPQTEMCFCRCKQGPGDESQALEVRPGENSGVGCVETA